MTKIHIFGIDHFLQNADSVCFTEKGKESEAKQKAAFEAIIVALICQRGIELLADEAKLEGSVLTERIAKGKCRYLNVTMPHPERERLGICKDYESDEQSKKFALEQFERYMFGKIQQQRGDAKSILVLCGRLHVDGLTRLFQSVGDSVTSEDVHKADWFKGPPAEDIISGEFLGNVHTDFVR